MKFTAVAAAVALSSTTEAKTHRQALATVYNDTPNHVISVSLLHKYSDVYKNHEEYGMIKPYGDSGLSFGVPYCHADFNTGFGTTGVDWWAVSWYTSDLQNFCFTDPANFRGFFDAVDHVAPPLITAVAGVAAAIISEGNPVATGKAVELAWATTNELFNTEGTKGYKQHMLTSDDSQRIVELHIKTNGKFEIHSPSGKSTTKYTCRRI